jgi:hypothetical protein
MAKITAAGLAKDENAGKTFSVYVVREAEGLRPANRKDGARRAVTTVLSVARIGDSRLYNVRTDSGPMNVQGSQWFDLVDLDVKDNPAEVPAIEAPPVADTDVSTDEMPDDAQAYGVGYEHGERDARAALDEEIRGLLNRIAELTVKNADQGFSLVADQVGILHAAYESEDTVTCREPIRSVVVIATGVRDLHPGRKVCPKCERKVRESAE